MAQKLGALALVLAVALGAALWLGGSGAPGSTSIGVTPALAEETPATLPLPEVPEMVLGNADAPVTIVEYASFTCPHCAAFHETVFKDLKKDYIDTGKVKFIYREVYFDRYGLWAAMLARCGGETRYFGINAMLFEQQKEWAGTDDAAAAVENLRKIGRTAGMDDATIDACMQDAAMAQALVLKYEENKKKDEVTSTPTLFINGERYSNMSYEDLKAILDEKLG